MYKYEYNNTQRTQNKKIKKKHDTNIDRQQLSRYENNIFNSKSIIIIRRRILNIFYALQLHCYTDINIMFWIQLNKKKETKFCQ